MSKLETICLNYKANNQKLQEHLNGLTQTSETLKTESSSLREQLTNERKLTVSLNKSLKQYELNELRLQDKVSEQAKIINELELINEKLKRVCFYMAGSVVIILFIIATVLFIKLKLP